MFSTGVFAAFEDFTDVKGHWAEETLRKAHDDSIIEGYNETTLAPNDSITTAQMITIICRVLNAQKTADTAGLGIPSDIWYADAAGKALYMGLISSETGSLDKPMSRGDALYMMAKAFQIIKGDPDISVLNAYPDGSSLTGEKRRAIASLVEDGHVEGYDGLLHVKDNITRAEFLTVLYRVAGNFVDAKFAGNLREGSGIISGNSTLNGVNLKNVWFSSNADNVSLRGVTVQTVVLRTDSLSNLSLSGSTSIGRLVFANDESPVEFNANGSVSVNTAVVGDGKDSVALSGNIANIEVTGSSRDVTADSPVQKLAVAGNDNNLKVRADVEELIVYGSRNSIEISGSVKKLTLMGTGAKITGSGVIETAEVHVRDYEITAEVKEYLDMGIASADVALAAPQKLAAGKTLQVTAKVENAPEGKTCKAVWLVDGKQVSESTVTLAASNEYKLEHRYTYSKNMALASNVRFELRYVTLAGEEQVVSAEANITLENYSDAYYDADDILNRVKTGYQGNYTLAWAQSHDYTKVEKERWVNEKGYSSSSKYLIWVNTTYQRVNVFEGSKGSWTLIRSGIVATGASSSPTPVGVWKTTFKQSAWVTDTYIARPIVRFKGGGYAFHSRLYSPSNPSRLNDSRIGFPVSHGCIRMYDEDIQWLYNNVPSGTTVVVF